jgi:hypothetical protein
MIFNLFACSLIWKVPLARQVKQHSIIITKILTG